MDYLHEYISQNLDYIVLNNQHLHDISGSEFVENKSQNTRATRFD